jgi:hypothetical protein
MALVFGAALACPRVARANGRFPNALALREVDQETLVVAGTYGLLVTTNGGRDFAYQCETELFGKPTGTYTVDPLLELGPDGAILSGSLQGLRVSRDYGCTFETEPSLPRNWGFFEVARPDGAENGEIVDACRRGAGETAPVLALVSLKDDAGTRVEYRLYEAGADGVFSVVGAPIATSLMDFGLTIEVAPSDPNRIYVTGTLATDPVLLASDDGGESFSEMPLVFDDPDDVIGAYLGAVAPDDPERVYVRVARRIMTENGLYFRDDSLAVSDDGGATTREVVRQRANLLGFALSPDGETVLAGFGDPRVDETLSDSTYVGIYSATATELAFERTVSDLDVSCLRWTDNGLYACATERDPLGEDPDHPNDFHLGVFRGSGVPTSIDDFTPLLKMKDVRGPAPWADGRVTSCMMEWTDGDPQAPVPTGTCARFSACASDVPLSPGALVCGSSGGGAGGEGTGGNGASTTGGSGVSGTANDPAGKDLSAEPECGCRTAPRPANGGLYWAFAFLLVWWHEFRARCRRSNF